MHKGPCAEKKRRADALRDAAGGAAGGGGAEAEEFSDGEADGNRDGAAEEEGHWSEHLYEAWQECGAEDEEDAAEVDDAGAAEDAGGAAEGALHLGDPAAVLDAAIAAAGVDLPADHHKMLLVSVTQLLKFSSGLSNFQSALRVTTNDNALESATIIMKRSFSKLAYEQYRADRAEDDTNQFNRHMATANAGGCRPGFFEATRPKRSRFMGYAPALRRTRTLLEPIFPPPTILPSIPTRVGLTSVHFDLHSSVRVAMEQGLPPNTYLFPDLSLPAPVLGAAVETWESPFVHSMYSKYVENFNSAPSTPLRSVLSHVARLLGFDGFVYRPLLVAVDEDATLGRKRFPIDAVAGRLLSLCPSGQGNPFFVFPIAILDKADVKGMSPAEALPLHVDYQQQLERVNEQFRSCSFVLCRRNPGGPPDDRNLLVIADPILALFVLDNQSADKLTGTSPSACLWCHAPKADFSICPVTASRRDADPDTAVTYRELFEKSKSLIDSTPVAGSSELLLTQHRRLVIEHEKTLKGLGFTSSNLAPPAWALTTPSRSLPFTFPSATIHSHVAPDGLHVHLHGVFKLFTQLIFDRITAVGDIASFDEAFIDVSGSPAPLDDARRRYRPHPEGLRQNVAEATGGTRESKFRGIVASLILSCGEDSGLSVAEERDIVHVCELALITHSTTGRERSPAAVLDFVHEEVLPAFNRLAPYTFPWQKSGCKTRKLHTYNHLVEAARVFGGLRGVSTEVFEANNKTYSAAAEAVSFKFGSREAQLQIAQRLWLSSSILFVNSYRYPSSIVAPPPFEAVAARYRPGPALAADSPKGRLLAAALLRAGVPESDLSEAIASLPSLEYVTMRRSLHGRAVMDGTLRARNWVRASVGSSAVSFAGLTLCRVEFITRDSEGALFFLVTAWTPSDTDVTSISPATVAAPPRSATTPLSRGTLLHHFMRACAPTEAILVPATEVAGTALVYSRKGARIYAPFLEPQLYA